MDNCYIYKNLFTEDCNGRIINLYKIENVVPCGQNLFYPNVRFINEKKDLINPINEKIMSLGKFESEINEIIYCNTKEKTKTNSNPLFFFVYNTDNYYHFIYDSLPYLISYLELKKEIPELKILMNYPNFQKKSNYKFVTEFLEILSLGEEEIEIINPNTKYETVYVSNSYTHDGKSNIPPRNEIYDFYKKIVNIVKNKFNTNQNYPKNIYVSRRTWINNDLSNIGTNYTSKRKLVNEDDVVNYLIKNDFVEIFTESLTTIEKILLFSSVKNIVGPIGGGLCNVLFSNEDTKLKVLNSPTFLDVNKRFIFSFDKVDYEIFDISSHVESGEIKKFMRVKFDDKVGEVINIENDKLTINFSYSSVAGWNNDIVFNKITKNINEVEKLDEGLNSEWKIDLHLLKEMI